MSTNIAGCEYAFYIDEGVELVVPHTLLTECSITFEAPGPGWYYEVALYDRQGTFENRFPSGLNVPPHIRKHVIRYATNATHEVKWTLPATTSTTRYYLYAFTASSSPPKRSLAMDYSNPESLWYHKSYDVYARLEERLSSKILKDVPDIGVAYDDNGNIHVGALGAILGPILNLLQGDRGEIERYQLNYISGVKGHSPNATRYWDVRKPNDGRSSDNHLLLNYPEPMEGGVRRTQAINCQFRWRNP